MLLRCIIIVIWLVGLPAAALSAEQIRVTTVTPVITEGSLGAAITCASIFSDRSLSTLQSGLSAVVRLELQLQRAGRTRTLMSGGGEFKTVHETVRARSIAYDVWDEIYTIRTPGHTQQIADLEGALRAVSEFAHDGLMPVADLEPGVYRVRARVQLLPVSPEQGERVAAYLQSPNDTQASAGPSGRRSAEFDVGGLLAMLWGRGQARRDRSPWMVSEILEISAGAGIER